MAELEWRCLAWLFLWVVSIGAVVVDRCRGQAPRGSGLVLAYLAFFGAVHIPGAVIHLMSESRDLGLGLVEAGLCQSALGALAFALGCLVHSFRLRRRRGDATVGDSGPRGLALIYFGVGLAASMALRWLLYEVPTATALLSVAAYLLVVGICLGCWNAWMERKKFAMLAWVAIAMALPLYTIVRERHLGFGVVMSFMVACFLISTYRPRRRVLLGMVLGCYFLVSLFVTYMELRWRVREWTRRDAPLVQRVEFAAWTVENIRPFNPADSNQLYHLKRRLEQNHLVGAAVFQIGSRVEFARGRLFQDALASLVPRVLWPEKPYHGGGGRVVGQFTGFNFPESQSVGMGQVLEFYIGFGTAGVVLGFFVLGFLLAAIDSAAIRKLVEGKPKAFATIYLMGIVIIKPESSLLEIVPCVAAALVGVGILNRVVTLGHRNKSVSVEPCQVEVGR